MSRSAAVLFSTLLALLVASAPGPSPARAESFGESISVTEIQIPVTVLRDYEPVRGLTRDDFVVTDDGEPREIVGFRVIDLGESAAAGTAGGSAPEAAAPTDQVEEGRRILVLFDLVFSRPHKLEQALRGVERMVGEQLHPADRVAVAYVTSGGSRLLTGFTSARDETGAALDAVGAILDGKPARLRESLARIQRKEAAAAGASRARSLSDRLGPAASIALLSGIETEGGPSASLPYGAGNVLADATFGDAEFVDDPTIASVGRTDPFSIGRDLAAASFTSSVRARSLEMERLLTLLRDVPSPKQVLFLSEGLGPSVLQDFGSTEAAPVLRALDDLTEALRRAGWTLHAIDVGGIPDPFSRSGFSSGSLVRLAHQSGGLVFRNYNRIGIATGKLARRTSVTYVLTIRPGELVANGRHHQLDVRLRQPERGTRLVHRPGYYAPKPGDDKTHLERRLDTVDLLLGAQEIDEIQVRVLTRVVPGTLAEAEAGGRAAVPLVIELPASELAAALDGPAGVRAVGVGSAGSARMGRRSVGLDLQVYAIDADGGVQDLWLRSIGLDLDRVGDLVRRGGVRIMGGLELPPGTYRLRTLVRESAGGRSSLSSTPVTVAAPDEGSLLAMDPVWIDRPGEWLELAALPESVAAGAGRLLTAGGSGGRPMVPAARPTVGPGEFLGVLVVADGARPVEVSARVVEAGREGGGGASGGVVPLRPERGGRVGGPVRYLGRVDAADLAPGKHGLEVRVAEVGSERVERRMLEFEVRGR